MRDGGYPIGAVSVLTGLSVDVLRKWERRYGLVAPARDARGRVYDEADVRRLQLLAAAVARGHPVGRLAGLDDAALAALVRATTAIPDATLPVSRVAASRRGRASSPDAPPGLSAPVSRILAALRRFDAFEVEQEIGRVAASLPPRELVHSWVMPLVRVTGEEWHAGRLSIAQEHVLSAALRSLLGGIIRAMPQGGKRASLLLTTLPRDRHEFGILGASLLAAAAGVRVIYLGPDLPADETVDAARRSGAGVVVIGSTYTDAPARAATDVDRIARRLPAGIELWLGGALAPRLRSAAPAALIFTDLMTFEAELARLMGRG